MRNDSHIELALKLGLVVSLGLLMVLLLMAFADAASTTLNWQDNSGKNNDTEEGFSIERNDNGAGYKNIGTVTSNVTTYVDNTLVAPPAANPPATNTYCFQVIAFNKAGKAAPSNQACVDVLGVALLLPPAAASNLTASQVSAASATKAPAKAGGKK